MITDRTSHPPIRSSNPKKASMHARRIRFPQPHRPVRDPARDRLRRHGHGLRGAPGQPAPAGGRQGGQGLVRVPRSDPAAAVTRPRSWPGCATPGSPRSTRRAPTTTAARLAPFFAMEYIPNARPITEYATGQAARLTVSGSSSSSRSATRSTTAISAASSTAT